MKTFRLISFLKFKLPFILTAAIQVSLGCLLMSNKHVSSYFNKIGF